MTPLARNLNNLILVVDLARRDSLVLLGDTIRTYIARGIPVRFGMVPLLGLGDRLGEETTTGGMVAKVVWYLVETVGRAQAMQFLNDVSARSRHFCTLWLLPVWLCMLTSLSPQC